MKTLILKLTHPGLENIISTDCHFMLKKSLLGVQRGGFNVSHFQFVCGNCSV